MKSHLYIKTETVNENHNTNMYMKHKSFVILYVFTVTFNQLNASLVNKKNNVFKTVCEMSEISLIGIDIATFTYSHTKILFTFKDFLYVLWIILRFYLRERNIPDIFLGKHLDIVEPQVFPAPTSLSHVFTSELTLSLCDSRAKPVIGHGSSILQSFPKAFHPNLWEDEWKWVASKQALGGAIK